eukprot:6020274-Amphidinium_carterae.2
MKERGIGPLKPLDSVLEDLDNVELCHDLLDDEDVHEIKAKKKREAKNHTLKKPEQASASSASASAAPAATATVQPALDARKAYGVKINWSNFTPKDLKPLIPPGKTKDVFLQRELKLASRWRAKYPTTHGPKSFSMVYHDEVTEKLS